LTDNQTIYYLLTGEVNSYCNKRIKRIRCVKQKLREELSKDPNIVIEDYYNIPELEDFFHGKIRDMENMKRTWQNILKRELLEK
jgi:hypothetical protein